MSLKQFSKLAEWLPQDESHSENRRYFHILLREKVAKRGEIIDAIRDMFQEAHDDARQHFLRPFEVSLDPLEEETNQAQTVLENYPHSLDIITLKGYFGEIFAAIVAENYSPLSISDWEVPAFLFRFHNLAFDQLERQRQIGIPPGTIPGRTGDDNVAFCRDENGTIIRALHCEAKCTSDHDSNLVSDAHTQISSTNPKPIELRRLMEILKDFDTPEANAWIRAIRKLYFQSDLSNYERCDMVCYVHGRLPIQKPTWISRDSPHRSYTANRRLAAVEIYFEGVEDLIHEVYRKRDSS